jgi:hypothetical protein
VKYGRAYVNEVEYLGSAKLGVSTEPFRVYYRTAGIADNTGSWSLLDSTGDMSGVAGASEVQFMFEFRIFGPFCIPARILSIICTYENDLETDSHYQPSTSKSDAASRRFAYRQAAAWGSNIPPLRIRVYNVATGLPILDDTTTAHASGVFEYSLNGTDWFAWDDTKDTVGNYIRYTATSLPDGITVTTLLTLA